MASETITAPSTTHPVLLYSRFLAWSVVCTLVVFLLNVYLSFWREWPGAGAVLGEDSSALAWLQLLFYLLAVGLSGLFVWRTVDRDPRKDNDLITASAAFVARFAFWVVMLVGLADAVISFLRVEEMLAGFVGEQMAQDLGRNHYRAPMVHGPLILLSLLLAAVTRTLGFTWLALLVVISELQIVISRFVFSYEQAFMADLVRFWYAGLFLFSSAFTLVEDGHVRVDVIYQGLSEPTKGLINALGSLVLGLPLCWVVLVVGLGQPYSVISSPLLALEISQSGFGMYVKYLLAAMLAVFVVTMTLQFSAYFLNGMANYFQLPGGRSTADNHAHPTA